MFLFLPEFCQTVPKIILPWSSLSSVKTVIFYICQNVNQANLILVLEYIHLYIQAEAYKKCLSFAQQ